MTAVVAFPFTCFTSDEIDDHDDADVPMQPATASAINEETTSSSGTPPASALAGEPTTEEADVFCQAEPTMTMETEAAADTQESDYVLIDAMIDEALEDEEDTITSNNDNNDMTSVSKHDVMEESAASHSEDTTTYMTGIVSTSQQEKSGYGGLSNLGNTCYLNSALQMTASLDEFVKELARVVKTASVAEEEPELLHAFLDVMASLSKGETVSPTAFKDAIDKRTPLFLGYHQEDSHEFLTTLLDLLDKDIKSLLKPKQPKQPLSEEVDAPGKAPSTEASAGDDQVMDDETERETESESYESPTKRPKSPQTADVESQLPLPATGETQGMTTCQSFSDLQPEGIQELLHARLHVDNDNDNADTDSTTPTTSKCKLAGGRVMPASLVEPSSMLLTTIDNNNNYNNHNNNISTEDGDISGRAQHNSSCAQEQTETAQAQPSLPSPQVEQSEPSPVDAYFKMEARVRLTCDSCKYTRTHTEDFLHLSLGIGGQDSSVEDGLRRFFAPEKRDIKCEKCFCETATQAMEITRLPRALLLHFKRFIVNVSSDYSSITYRKDQSGVAFDAALKLDDLADYMARDVSLPEQVQRDGRQNASYNIRSVVNHHGASATFGHYTADALRSYHNDSSDYDDDDQQQRQQEGRRWTRFNDSYVSKISADEAIGGSAKTAYMVMYELC